MSFTASVMQHVAVLGTNNLVCADDCRNTGNAADELLWLCADVENLERLSPLHCAALADSTSCAKLLLDAKADLALASSDGRSVTRNLGWAQREGCRSLYGARGQLKSY